MAEDNNKGDEWPGRAIGLGESVTISYRRYREAVRAGIIDHPSMGIDRSYTERLRITEREYLADLRALTQGETARSR